MKKLILIIIIFLSWLPCSQIWAQADTTNNILNQRVKERVYKTQAPYKASVGGMFPSFLTMGASSKIFFNECGAFQAELLFKTVFAIGKKDISFGDITAIYSNLETNLNIIYQKKIKEKKNAELFWLIGGGISFGYNFEVQGKFGVNTIVGLEYVFKKKPLALQIDFRPGYGMLFSFDSSNVKGFFFEHESPWPHFDWLFGFTLRYTLKDK
jgi:hypothetical protein